jgi:hypothetical protein
MTVRVSRPARVESMAHMGSTGAFIDVLATILRADDVVAMASEGRVVG